MFIGLFGADVGLKLSESDRSALLDEAGAGPFGPPERPMSGYVGMPARWRSTPGAADRWVAIALEHVGALAPKPTKTPKPPSGRS